MIRFAAHLIFFTLVALAPWAPARGAALNLEMRQVWNGEGLFLDALRYENAARETLSITRCSYLLSEFGLEREDGVWIELPGQFAWMDVEHHRRTAQLPEIPPGRYRALRFQVGLDSATNSTDPAQWGAGHPLNPNLNGLHWSWQGGYIFLALEGRYRAGSEDLKGFSYHLARSANATRVSLTVPLDLAHGDATAVVDFDLAALLNAPRALAFESDGDATHSRDGDGVAAALVANLPGAFRVYQVVSSAPEISRPSPVKPLYLPEAFTPYPLTFNRTFPFPALPRDNPLLVERVELGARLFRETALSRDNSLSCSSCHQADAGFSDARRFSFGVGARTGSRHAMPLLNLAWKTSFFWDGRAPSLRVQALMPLQDHAEMDETTEHVCAKLSALDDYPRLFRAAFGSLEITPEKIGLALENFLLTLTAGNSKLDRAMQGKATLNENEQRGFELFMTENDPRTGHRGADCFHCHGGPLFTDHAFHNNGLPLSESDPGRSGVTGCESDRGKFATPSLRDVSRRGPYMHDGRFATLEEVVAHYSTGIQRTSTLDPNLAKHPPGGLGLSREDQAALVAFLKALAEGN